MNVTNAVVRLTNILGLSPRRTDSGAARLRQVFGVPGGDEAH